MAACTSNTSIGTDRYQAFTFMVAVARHARYAAVAIRARTAVTRMETSRRLGDGHPDRVVPARAVGRRRRLLIGLDCLHPGTGVLV